MKKEKIYNLLLFILIFLTILSIVLIKPLGNLDELWNYNFAKNISEGHIPYKDFNMLQMPLLPIICGIILKIFANELIVMRILAALLCTTVLYLAYKIFNTLNIKKEVSYIYLFLIGCMFSDLFCIDYNFATLLLVLLIILKEIKNYKKDNTLIKADYKTDSFLGILAGSTVTLKQTTGLFVCIVLLGNKLIFVKNKEEIKVYLKSFAFRLLGILIPTSIMLIYLYINNAISDFINYTISGVSGFSNYIPYTNLIKFDLIGILSIIVPITFIYEWGKNIILGRNKTEYIFLVYGLAMFVVVFPISDDIHFLIGALPTIILLLNKIYILFKKLCSKAFASKDIKFFKTVIYFVSAFLILITVYLTIINFKSYIKETNHSQLEHYRYIIINENFEKEIETIKEYIQASNKNVKILDATAAIYTIPTNIYNKNYDMLLKGNLGKNGEEKLIQEIQENNNTQYLVLKDNFTKNWQTPIDVINYVLENKTKIGKIEIFDIYE